MVFEDPDTLISLENSNCYFLSIVEATKKQELDVLLNSINAGMLLISIVENMGIFVQIIRKMKIEDQVGGS